MSVLSSTMKNFLFSFIILIFAISANSQTYNNEWINYSQIYYKIPIAKTGLYKLDYTKLLSAGIPVNTINPKNIQLFQKGVELPLFFQGESDGVFNNSDYLIFYAEKNTCKDDSSLFYFGNFLANPYFSVVNDTSAVFLTWNTSNINKRYVIETDSSFTSYNNSQYFIKEEVIAFNNLYNAGPQTSVGSTDPRYSQGEGFSSNALTMGQSSSVTFNTSTLVNSGPSLSLSVVHSGMSNPFIFPDHDISIEYQDLNGNWNNLTNYSYDGYKTFKNDFSLNGATIGTSLNVKLNNLTNSQFDANSTRIGVHYYKLSFPSNYNLLNSTEQTMYIGNDNLQAKSLITISNFNSNNSVPILIDLTNNKWITTSYYTGTIKALIPNNLNSMKCYISSYANLSTSLDLYPVNGNGSFIDYQNFATDSAFVIVTHSSLLNSVNQYAAYRSSGAGGAHNVIVANIADLNNQFAFGVNGHPNAIKKFVNFLIANYPSIPKNLLLIGKSIHQQEQLIVNNPQISAASRIINGSYNLVQSFGYPACDNLLTQGIQNPSSLAPAVPTGRISALKDSTVLNYLNKVILHEAQVGGEAWQKKALHFVGGNNAYEQSVFNQYMLANENILRDSLFGGDVFTFKKTTTAPIGINTNDSIKNVIERGIALLTFFGHGSVSGFEQNIDEPTSFNNSPRFPFLISNSCYTGDYHLPGVISTSERFVLANNHGTIGFLASVSTGISYALQYYTEQFYKNYSKTHYGESYGEIIKNSILNTETLPFTLADSIVKITVQEMSLQGDPSVKPIITRKPDYVLTNADINIDTESSVNEISISVHYENLGMAKNDSIVLYMQRILPNGNSTYFYKSLKATNNHDDFTYSIPKDLINGIGLNKFFFHIDYYNEVNELNENNNTTNGYINAFIRGADIYPVYPYNYAVIPNLTSVTLKASTADPIAPMTTYRLQVDTNDLFLNPIINTTLSSSGGVINYNANLLSTDSTVYFWRIGKDHSNLDSINWRESSFQTITNKSGWSQAHFHQFKNDNYQYVFYNKPARKFEFKNSINALFCRTGAVGDPSPPYLNFAENAYYLNNALQVLFSCGGAAGWSFAIFDSITGLPVPSDTNINLNNGTWLTQFNSCACIPQSRNVFDFSLNNFCGDNNGNIPAYLQRIEDFLNIIPNGSHVLAYSRNSDPSSSYPPSLIQAFQTIGSDSIQLKTDNTNIIISGIKKPFAHTNAKEALSNTYTEIITLADTFSSKWNSGYIESELIGPSTNWKSFHWRFKSYESPSTDSIYVKLIGVRASGLVDTLATFTKDSLDVSNLSIYANATTYPYLKLVAFESDLINHSAPQLTRWQVLFDEVPECAINVQKGFEIKSSPIAEGNNISIKVPIENIGEISFPDSLVVTYWIEDAYGVNHNLPNKLKRNNFQPDSVLLDTVTINTLGYAGANALWVNVNPLGNTYNQNEQYYFNNIIRIPFDVRGDKINPLLDVTFDGIHILNGDIISPTPNILITLKDENKFLALNDTSDFNLYLKRPNVLEETRVYFKDGLIFTPAQLPTNSCKIEYNPIGLVDGTYQLRVQAKDRSANVSGSNDYKIQFEIINKSTITEVLNYPNPFSTSTRFVFTLTGQTVPDIFKIQIMTITGKIVKEITKEELGNIHIGRNITEYAWNGKDEFGDQLANGVYLYRTVTQLNGEKMEKKETAADDYFKKGWGKLVIMR